ncbi:hypothetical protein [Pontibacter chitinilyticus]|uniref:hypothetical protein n=1 Tax=Pontibacter chitinilyticus TaxID=2674989 RepID=UPI00321B667A
MFLASLHTLFSTRRRTAGLLLAFCFAWLTMSASAAAPDYVEEYYPVIHKAEMEVIYQNYAAALADYQLAFSSVPSPFAHDYYNAAICALLLQNEKQAYEYLNKLVEKGVSLEYLKRQPLLDSLTGTRQWKKFRRKYKKHRRTYQEHINPDLRADLDELYARDQYFRQAPGGLRVYGDTIRKIEAANVQKLLAWVAQYGYPGEDLIGVADTLEQLPRYTVVIQRQTKARNGHDFTTVLDSAVHQGQLAPTAAAYLLEQQAGRSTYGAKALVRVNCSACEDEKEKPAELGQYLVESRSKAERKQIASRRRSLGLEPLEDYRIKALYSLIDNRFKLVNDWAVVNYYVPSSEAASTLMERLKTLQESLQE